MRLIFCITLLLLAFKKEQAQTPSNDIHWQMVWKDDFVQKKHFDNTYPLGNAFNKVFNNGRWVLRGANNYWTVDEGDHGGEPQAYSPNNVTFDAEGIVMTAKKEEYYCSPPCSIDHHHYTSGSISGELNVQNVQYGYVEAKIKLEDTYGLFPAFWTWRQVGNVGDPNYDYDEIDIFEMAPGTLSSCVYSPLGVVRQTKNYSTSNLHTNDFGQEVGCTLLEDDRGQTHYLPNDGYLGWHKYAMEWSPSKIILFFDDIPFRVIPNPGYPNIPTGKISQKTYLIINQALANYVAFDYPAKGTNGYYDPTLTNYSDYFNGKIDNVNYYSGPYDLNTVPSEMKVEYVAYYLPNFDCTTPITITSSNINAADSQIKSTITTSGTISLPSSKIWRATDNVTINGDFTVPVGKELYIDVTPCY